MTDHNERDRYSSDVDKLCASSHIIKIGHEQQPGAPKALPLSIPPWLPEHPHAFSRTPCHLKTKG